MVSLPSGLFRSVSLSSRKVGGSRRFISIFPSVHGKRNLCPATPVGVASSFITKDERTFSDGEEGREKKAGRKKNRRREEADNAGSSTKTVCCYSAAGQLAPAWTMHNLGTLRKTQKEEGILETIRYPGSNVGGGIGIQNVKIDFDREGRPLTIREINALKKTFHHLIWKALYTCNWDKWEQLFTRFRSLGLPYDEVSYTLKLHGYVLSHRHKSEKAYLVIEEMKKAQMHPAVIRLNEVNSACSEMKRSSLWVFRELLKLSHFYILAEMVYITNIIYLYDLNC
eukprot:GHVS01098241.1.p1 GENE.GHVS01098241.1~~GHVS01098241.1.p1  ORF type:complete len:283 (-),score=32.01 GHVS01098241.1:500-1348(-)